MILALLFIAIKGCEATETSADLRLIPSELFEELELCCKKVHDEASQVSYEEFYDYLDRTKNTLKRINDHLKGQEKLKNENFTSKNEISARFKNFRKEIDRDFKEFFAKKINPTNKHFKELSDVMIEVFREVLIQYLQKYELLFTDSSAFDDKKSNLVLLDEKNFEIIKQISNFLTEMCRIAPLAQKNSPNGENLENETKVLGEIVINLMDLVKKVFGFNIY